MQTKDREQRMSVASSEIMRAIQTHELSPSETVEVLSGMCAMMVQDTRFEMDQTMKAFLANLEED